MWRNVRAAALNATLQLLVIIKRYASTLGFFFILYIYIYISWKGSHKTLKLNWKYFELGLIVELNK